MFVRFVANERRPTRRVGTWDSPGGLDELDVTPDNLGKKGEEFEGKTGVDEYISAPCKLCQLSKTEI
jgi:hypothetical protein